MNVNSMNNNSMFTPVLNPYADNAKFIKKTMRPKHCVFIVLGIAVMLVCLVYAVISVFNMSKGERAVFQTPDEESVLALNLFLLGARMLFFIIILAIPCIGTVNFIEHLKDKESPYLPNSFSNMGSTFFISCLVYYISIFFTSFAQLGLTLLFGNYETLDGLIPNFAKVFFVDTVPSVVFILWSVSGIIFCSSVRNTLKGVMLSYKGAVFFTVMSIFVAVTNGISALIYNFNNFGVGIFYSFDGNTALSDTVKSNSAAIFMLNLFFAASIVVLIAAVRFASDYRRAVKAAQRSFAGFGSNLYMNGDSAAAAYYQNFYSSPNGNGNINNFNVQSVTPVDMAVPPCSVEADDYMRVDPPGNNNIGTEQPYTTIVVCPVCGTANKINCKFCVGCGNSLVF